MTAWSQLADTMRALDETRHTVICEPGQKERVETLIQRYDLSHLWTVRESAHCPAGGLLVVKNPPGI